MNRQRSIWQFILILSIFLCSCKTAVSEVFAFPSNLTNVHEEAFYGNTALQEVILPDGVLSLGDRCFYGCENLSRITVPASVSAIGTDCFQDCPPDLLILAVPDSPAMQWAQDHDVDFQAETHYRALLIAQSYKACAYPRLNGPDTDVEIMRQCLSSPGGTAYEITVRQELSASGILEEIQACFGMAQEQDVSLFFYSGHGKFSTDPSQQGALIGADGGTVTASALRAALDQIPGRKIIILDSCYSGALLPAKTAPLLLLEEDGGKEKTAADFLASFTAAFSTRSRSAGEYSRYFMLTSAAENEECYEDQIGNQVAGLFTANLVHGLGYNPWIQAYADRIADSNQNGTVTLREAYQYTHRKLVAEGQHVQVYPADCDWLGIIRAEKTE